MTDITISFPAGQARKCKGRNPYNADALIVRHDPKSETLMLIGRVASNQSLHHGWTSLPADHGTLSALRDAIDNIMSENAAADGRGRNEAADHGQISHDTMITGAEFRNFYQNHWPRDWYVEDMYVPFEDDEGNFTLQDDETHRLGDFGWAGWQGEGGAGADIAGRSIADLYIEVMGATPPCLVTFRVDPDNLDALVQAGEVLGATRV